MQEMKNIYIYIYIYIYSTQLNPKLINQPEDFDFFGSLFTTTIVNCAKWLQHVPQTKGSYMITTRQNQEQYTRLKNSKLINISNLE
jgi:hypothetical protein